MKCRFIRMAAGMCNSTAAGQKRRWPGWLLLGLSAAYAVSVLLSVGCSQKANQATASPTVSAWSWNAYPPMNKMRLALLPCRVLPKTSITINSPFSGQLRLYVDRAQTNLPAGRIWAEFEPKILSAESNALAEAKERFSERERMLLELELPKQKFKLAREIEEAQRQLSLLELLVTNQTLAISAVNLVGLKDRTLTQEVVQRSRQELNLMKENYQYLMATNLALLGVDLQGQRTEFQRRELEFERQQIQARFKMPFTGQLNCSLQLSEGISDYPINAGQEIGVARDLSAILVRIALADASWSTLSPESLAAVVNLPDGTRLEAAFAFKRLERLQAREEIVFYFQFPAEKASAAVRLLGTDLSCELWLALAQPARLVPKLTLVLNQPSLFQNRRWSEGVAQLSPGSRVLVEGQTDLAITTAESKP